MLKMNAMTLHCLGYIYIYIYIYMCIYTYIYIYIYVMNNSFINLAKRSRFKQINILGNNENNLPHQILKEETTKICLYYFIILQYIIYIYV